MYHHLVGIDLPELIRLKPTIHSHHIRVNTHVGIDLPDLFKRKFLVMPE